jgi:hypothetical protein
MRKTGCLLSSAIPRCGKGSERFYRKGSDIAAKVCAARGKPAHLTEAQYERFMTSGQSLWDHLGEAPVILVVCAKQRAQPARDALPPEIDSNAELGHAAPIRGASIYPAGRAPYAKLH